MTLLYFDFYRGNVIDGFTRIYGKQVGDHAFLMTQPTAAVGEEIDIASPIWDFNPAEGESMYRDANLRRFIGQWVDVSESWSRFDDRIHEQIAMWQPYHQAVTGARTDEWGLHLFDTELGQELTFVGANAYPDGFDVFEKWLKQVAGGAKIR